MVIKSLTITENAYDALKTLKYGNESFTDVILRVTKDRTKLIDKYFGIFKGGETEAANLINKIKKRKAEVDKDFEIKKIKLNAIGVK